MPDRRVLASIAELVDIVELTGVRFTSVHAARLSVEDPEALEIEGAGSPVQINLQPAHSEDGRSFSVLASAETRRPEFEINASVEVAYRFTEPIAEMDEDLMGQFLGTSVVVTAAPYLREAFTSLGARIEVRDTGFPLVRAGAVTRIDESDSAPEEPTTVT